MAVATLSGRETEVVQARADGTPWMCVADDLWLHDTTVKRHMQHARQRHGCATDDELIALAREKGWIE